MANKKKIKKTTKPKKVKKILEVTNRKKTRKNIRKVIESADLNLFTQIATKQEEDRKERVRQNVALVSTTKHYSLF